MGEEESNIKTDPLAFTNFGSMAKNALKGLSSFNADNWTPSEGMSYGLGKSTPMSNYFSSESVIGNESAQNTAQAGKQSSNHLLEALKSVQSLYGGGMEGIPLAGSEDIRVKRDVYGRPYTTVNVSARNDDGTRKESTYFDLSGKPQKTTGDIMEGMGKVGTDTGPHSWDQKRINPYTGTSIG